MKTKKLHSSLIILSRIALGLVLILPIYLFASQSTPAYAVADCSVDYNIVNQWGNGLQADITITNNTSTAVQGWNLTWTFGSGQGFNSGWNATFNPSGSSMSASNVATHWNGTIGANGGTVAFGIIVNHNGNVTIPTDFAVNGVSCNDEDATPTNTAVPPTNTSQAPTNTPQAPTNTPQSPTNTPTTAPPTATTAPPTATPGSGGTCSVAYNIVNQWGNGFQADVVITNNSSSTINGWSLQWTFGGSEQFSSGWNATFSSSGQSVTASNPAGHWNGTLNANGGTAAFGFQGTHSGSVVVPSTFTLNGTVCGGPQPTATSTVPGPTATSTVPGPTPTNTPPGPTPTSPPPGTHVANPFVGADFYINPDYADSVMDQANATGGTLGSQMAMVADISTAVWMDRIAAITAGRGLAGHLDEALAQQNGSTPMTIIVVIYDLPNRDCAALASNGELLIAEDGLNRYKTEYIDPIMAILSDPAYSGLRIVTVIEPDSLPNLITNLSTPACAEANSTGAYVQGIQYAVDQLHTLPNVYIYLDIAHSGWLGWSSNFGPAVQLYVQTIQGTNNGLNSIDGFITNTANYTPVEEPFLPNPDLTVGGQQVKAATFFEFNPYFDELEFAQALRSSFISSGFPSDIGMLIDTSRNGWGGPDRPTQVSTSSTLDTYVDESRIDRRPHRGGWCNQAGAGIGERPQASPASGIDAFVWVKPPGESDGVSEPGIIDPDDPNKQFDGMCDPTAQNVYDPQFPTNALPDAPHAGRWFPEQFQMLVENAYPPLN